jgi:hypothetical protein
MADAFGGQADAWLNQQLWSQLPAFRAYLSSLVATGERLPKLRDFRPVVFPALMPSMFVARLSASGNLRISLIGDHLRTTSGWLPEGDYMATYHANERHHVRQVMHRLLERPSGCVLDRDITLPTLEIRLRAACFPVADTAGVPLGFLGIAEAKKLHAEQGRPYPVLSDRLRYLGITPVVAPHEYRRPVSPTEDNGGCRHQQE